jgi:hypothetical protein
MSISEYLRNYLVPTLQRWNAIWTLQRPLLNVERSACIPTATVGTSKIKEVYGVNHVFRNPRTNHQNLD